MIFILIAVIAVTGFAFVKVRRQRKARTAHSQGMAA